MLFIELDDGTIYRKTLQKKTHASKHCLRRYLTLQIIVNYTPVPRPKKVLGSIAKWVNNFNNYGLW